MRPQNFENAQIPPRYATCSFETLTQYENDNMDRAVRAAKQFVAAFPSVHKGPLLIGPTGIGKTHIAIAMLRGITYKGFHGIYYNTSKLLSTLRASYHRNATHSEEGVLEQVSEAELLILDDLGAERFTDWMNDMMHLVIDDRYNKRLPTVVTTNYPDTEIDDPDSLRLRVGNRIHSRLHQLCDFFSFHGADYRLLPGKPDARTLKTNQRKQRNPPYRGDQNRGRFSETPMSSHRGEPTPRPHQSDWQTEN